LSFDKIKERFKVVEINPPQDSREIKTYTHSSIRLGIFRILPGQSITQTTSSHQECDFDIHSSVDEHGSLKDEGPALPSSSQTTFRSLEDEQPAFSAQTAFPIRLSASSCLPLEVWEKILRLVVITKRKKYSFSSNKTTTFFVWSSIEVGRVCKMFSILIWKMYPRDLPLVLSSKTSPEQIKSVCSHLVQVSRFLFS
jgi:hypothetical protein